MAYELLTIIWWDNCWRIAAVYRREALTTRCRRADDRTCHCWTLPFYCDTISSALAYPTIDMKPPQQVRQQPPQPSPQQTVPTNHHQQLSRRFIEWQTNQAEPQHIKTTLEASKAANKRKKKKNMIQFKFILIVHRSINDCRSIKSDNRVHLSEFLRWSQITSVPLG